MQNKSLKEEECFMHAFSVPSIGIDLIDEIIVIFSENTFLFFIKIVVYIIYIYYIYIYLYIFKTYENYDIF